MTIKRQKFIKEKAQGEFGIEPEKRPTKDLLTYGIVNIDKPAGPTSHQIADYVKRILKLKKAGHSGTLDPNVTGVQPVAIGSATRITQFFLTAPKEYICLMHLHKDVDETIIKEKMQTFTGKIRQVPPIKSAVKRQERTREIYELEIIEIKGRDVLFRVLCQAGTYIRKLCHDIGQTIGCGAQMAQLRRTRAGPLDESDKLVTLTDLQDAVAIYREEENDKLLRHCIQPIENALKHLAKVWVFDTTIKSLLHGRDLAIPGISELENFRRGEIVAILTLKGELIAIGESLMSGVEINSQEKGLAVKTKKVFMQQLN